MKIKIPNNLHQQSHFPTHFTDEILSVRSASTFTSNYKYQKTTWAYL